MSAATLGFILFVIAHSGPTFSMTALQRYEDVGACKAAATAVTKAIDGGSGVDIVCLPEDAVRNLQELQR